MGWIHTLLQRVGIVRSVEAEPEPERMSDAEWEELRKSLAATQRARDAYEQERAEDAYEMRELDGIAREEARLLIREAVEEVQANMVGATANGVPYAELDRDGKLALLSHVVDWTDYINRGMDADLPDRIIFNAVDGKPPERWLEQRPEEAKAREAELGGYAKQSEQAVERINASIHEREAERPPEDSFEQIASDLQTYWDCLDGNLPEWREVDTEEKIAYLANFAGARDISYPRFVAGVQTMLQIAEWNGYECHLEAGLEDVCRSAYHEATAYHAERRRTLDAIKQEGREDPPRELPQQAAEPQQTQEQGHQLAPEMERRR